MGLAGPNCWLAALEKFTAALTAAATFRAMLGLGLEAADEEVRRYIFGNRVTHSKDGRVWTLAELQTLRHYGAVYDHPEVPYGKHLDAATNGCYLPHGSTVIYLGRLVPEADLVQDGDGRSHTTDAHDDQWRSIVGGVLSEVLDWLIENGGVRVLRPEVADLTTTPASQRSTKGCWQGASIVFPWSED